jgi:hypothetical protein
MDADDPCPRCGQPAECEICWFCLAHLCDRCWEEAGHCGHPEAVEINRKTAEATTWEERDELVRRFKIQRN